MKWAQGRAVQEDPDRSFMQTAAACRCERECGFLLKHCRGMEPGVRHPIESLLFLDKYKKE